MYPPLFGEVDDDDSWSTVPNAIVWRLIIMLDDVVVADFTDCFLLWYFLAPWFATVAVVRFRLSLGETMTKSSELEVDDDDCGDWRNKLVVVVFDAFAVVATNTFVWGETPLDDSDDVERPVLLDEAWLLLLVLFVWFVVVCDLNLVGDEVLYFK